ncbi:unnamed protein product [Rhizophagus irregularis]|nr:unnamed protein product [Rhizophagus irregularis]
MHGRLNFCQRIIRILGISLDEETKEHLLITECADGGRREEPVPYTPNEYLKLYQSCWDPEPNKRPSIGQVFNKLVKLGRTLKIQNFQDIKCDDDDEVQGIQDNNINDTGTQVTTEASINDTMVEFVEDVNDD